MGWLGRFFGNLTCGTVYDPFGELLGIAWGLPLPTVMGLNRSQRRKLVLANAKRAFWIIVAALTILSLITIALYAFLVRGAR